MKVAYASEILSLTRRDSGLHYIAQGITEDRLREFEIEDITKQMSSHAPLVWELLDELFSANPRLRYKREWGRKRAQEAAVAKRKPCKKVADFREADEQIGGVADDDDEAEYLEFLDESVPIVDADEDEPEDMSDQVEQRENALITIKKVVCVSVMLQSTNHKCNALQSIIGVFLQSCNTPETVREFLAHAGLSVSTTSINNAVNNLSKEAKAKMRELGQTFLASYAYDNLDIDLKHSVPTIEKSQDTLIHLTSGTMLPLYEVLPGDLDCSDEMWARSHLNPDIPRNVVPKVEPEDIAGLHREQEHPSGLLRDERFNAWKFLYDLLHYGPESIRKHKQNLGDPEVVDGIPLKKTSQVPNRALDVAPSTPAQNADALDALFSQGGIGDGTDNPHVQNINNSVVLVFGDLLTGERIRSLMESRSEEPTPRRRLQFVVYVMGLFHLKMACADAIWRVFIHPAQARKEDNALIKHISQIRPKETGKIESNPGFRRMHEVIQHVGIVSRLDCWSIEARKRGFETLDDFAASDPSLDELQQTANRLALEHVAGPDMSALRGGTEGSRDQQHENILLRQQYFLLYEQMSFAMNAGDIGRVETLFLPWMLIFQGCGKHKYAAELRRYLDNVHFIYPKGLSNAIRMNILCNPTGKKGAFRAIDWLVEHNNLYIKRIYGGKFSNHQKERILTESPLIEVYKNTRRQLEKFFCLDHKTTRHSPPKMKLTFARLAAYMQKHETNIHKSGRKTSYMIPDVMGKGMHVMMTPKAAAGMGAVGDEVDVEMDDEMGIEDDSGLPDEQEVEDDGSLDV
ncbi:hypothetical protein LshimejAT787_0604650 [Lyophyllum shimeji]|uniref:DUF6589 domain-containing protein n=1 Tax=Lyophyllum shimeji TaxID=47721 RepID=A0A9P3PPP8_LYOSH|nr:hypothetical protein LshimejAT787_0604650 [Lyophyllum shimeji]